MTVPKWRVIRPVGEVSVLPGAVTFDTAVSVSSTCDSGSCAHFPCMGSQTQMTRCPDAWTALICVAKCVSIFKTVR